MAASTPREVKPGRRPALWPYLVMPLIVLLIYCALYRVQHPHQPAPAATTETPAPGTGPSQQ
jgi:hypothetical protein